MTYTTIQKFEFLSKKSHQVCICFIKSAVKTVMWNIYNLIRI